MVTQEKESQKYIACTAMYWLFNPRSDNPLALSFGVLSSLFLVFSAIYVAAVYPVVAVPEEVLSGRTDAAITPQQTVHVVVETELAAGAVDAVQRAVDAWAEACTVSAQSVPASCGFDVPWPADFTSIASIDYRIDAYPSVADLGVDGVLVASDGVLVATVRGQAREGDEWRTYRTDDWTMRGAITFDGAQLVIRAF